jgi:cytochrome bd-type quinol oxidase subunit 2
VCQRANRLAAVLGIMVIVLLAVLDLASFGAQLEFLDALRARPWGMLPALTLAGFITALVFRSRNKVQRAYVASCAALFAAPATAAVGIFPNILQARSPNYALQIYDATVSRLGLRSRSAGGYAAFMLLVGYFVVIHSHACRHPGLITDLNAIFSSQI